MTDRPAETNSVKRPGQAGTEKSISSVSPEMRAAGAWVLFSSEEERFCGLSQQSIEDLAAEVYAAMEAHRPVV